MRQIKDKTGFAGLKIGEYRIATDTEIESGAVVKLEEDKVKAVDADETGAILGIAAECHGTSDALNSRATSKVIGVYDSPQAIYACAAPEITATSGSTTTIVSTSGFAAEDGTNKLVDNDFIGGYAKLVEKADDSENTDPVGTVYSITDSDAGDRELTIEEAGGAVTAGDKFAIFPPFGFKKGNFDTDRTGIVFTDVATLPVKVVGRNLDTEEIHLAPELHAYGNDNA